MRVLVTGGNGYVGSSLIPLLLNTGIDVLSVDLNWFGDYSPIHSHFESKIQDFSSLETRDLLDVDCVIHLAGIANDPAALLNSEFSWETNVLKTFQLLSTCRAAKVPHFIYASSGSVYGVSDREKVDEETTLNPISDYNKTKMVAERICMSFSDDLDVTIVRPATVCGVSKRMRFDVVVNLLCLQAFKTGEMVVLGGNQIRPNIHIHDMSRLYHNIVINESLHRGLFNAGFENLSVAAIAKKISGITNASIKVSPTNDPRSYRLDSTKLLDMGFEPLSSVDDAIEEILDSLQRKELLDRVEFHTVLRMKELGLG